MNFREILGVIKDKVSLSKTTVLSNPRSVSLHVCVLRATTHDPNNPPHDKHLTNLITLGHSSRATASTIISVLMDRLYHTGNSSVAFKCLIAVHIIIKRGSFILQDQLSVYPAFGGRNHLKLTDFRDGTTAVSWVLSSWVRWYAKYLDTLLSASRDLGFFLSNSPDKDQEEEKVSSTLDRDLIKEIDSLVGVIEETSKAPDYLHVEGNKLVYEVMEFVHHDYVSAINKVSLRISEFEERLSLMSFGDSVELTCALKRLEDCKERLCCLFKKNKGSVETFWVLLSEMKGKVRTVKGNREEGRFVTMGMGRRNSESESARFDERVLKPRHSLEFSSGRLWSDSHGRTVMVPFFSAQDIKR